MKYYLILFLILSVCGLSNAKLANQTTNADVAMLPVFAQKNTSPKVMIAMGYDHQLFIKAYSDYSDLDNDGKLDVSYQDNIEYVGYFNSDYCYVYKDNADVHYFKANSKVLNDTHKCPDSNIDFSGNFLNWVSMTRMDIIRFVLFGGKRLVDEVNQTILTRAFLPQDAHSFSKVFKRESGNYLPNNDSFSGINEKTITFCNTSLLGEPTLLAVDGDFPLWALNEKQQCQFDESSSTPNSNSQHENWKVNIQVCDDLTNESSHCQKYLNGQYKPKGIIQQYGESGKIEFGLISGSQINPHSGGVLRKNISKIGGNQDASLDEINLKTGQFNYVDGIISNVSAMRMIGVKDSMHANCNEYMISKNSYLTSDKKPADGTQSTLNTSCSDWGNPIAEIYLEALRYFSGQSEATAKFVESEYEDSDFVSGLSVAEKWNNQVDEQSACSSCAVLVISAGQNSFDQDDLINNGQVLPSLGSMADLNNMVDQVGQMQFENGFVNSGPYLNGENGHCESAQLTGLSKAMGVCPELPYLEGGYAVSGLSYFSATQDINKDLQGKQSISTYVLQLSNNVPKLSVDVSFTQSIEIIPVCQSRLNQTQSFAPCSFVDIKIVEQQLSKDGLTKVLKIKVYWEDSLWGGDYDLDATQELQICVGSDYCDGVNISNSEIYIKNSLKNFSSNDMKLSFNVVGSLDDGVNSTWLNYSGQWFDAEQDSIEVSNSKKYTLGKSLVTTLESPLWMAAKFGGFDDDHNDGIIHSQSQWDKRNNVTGQSQSDGVPDHYFSVINPANLAQQLQFMFVDVTHNKMSSSQISLQYDPMSDASIVYQSSYYQSKYSEQTSVDWVGDLQAFFVDKKGNVREDSDLNKQLTDDDYIIKMMDVEGAPFFQRYHWVDDKLAPFDSLQPIELVKPVWSANDFLSMDSENLDAQTQRQYQSNINQRYIFTQVNNQTLQFTNNDDLHAYKEYFSLNGANLTLDELILYIRGVELNGTRNRTLIHEGSEKTFRLADIINSSPHILRPPNNTVYEKQDPSYQLFKEQYKFRREVVLVGANDGMLHAFNAGFWNDSKQKVETKFTNESLTEFSLGSELWAFIPESVLPHLKWLANLDYQHNYYVDGEVQTFDVKIFDDDDVHPKGWGTIAVGSMGRGGFKQSFDIKGQSIELGSSYFILDVTDPEIPPVVLAQFTHSELGYTQAKAQLVLNTHPLTDELNWKLVFASGVTDLKTYTSDQSAKIFIYDFEAKELESFDSGIEDSYISKMTLADYNKDGLSDVLYFGLNQNLNENLSGSMFRFHLNDNRFSQLINVEQPISSAPLFVTDSKYNQWVFFGTGRFENRSDVKINKQSFDHTQQFFIGLKEPIDINGNLSFDTLFMDQLFDTTNIQHYQSGEIKDHQNLAVMSLDANIIHDSDQLKRYIQTIPGWKIRLNNEYDHPAGMNLNQALQYNQLLMFNQYIPSIESCKLTGNSILQYIDFRTGIASLDFQLIDPLEEDLNNIVKNGENPPDYDDKVIKNTLGFVDTLSNSPALIYTDQSAQVLVNGSNGSITSARVNTKFSKPARVGWQQLY